MASRRLRGPLSGMIRSPATARTGTRAAAEQADRSHGEQRHEDHRRGGATAIEGRRTGRNRRVAVVSSKPPGMSPARSLWAPRPPGGMTGQPPPRLVTPAAPLAQALAPSAGVSPFQCALALAGPSTRSAATAAQRRQGGLKPSWSA